MARRLQVEHKWIGHRLDTDDIIISNVMLSEAANDFDFTDADFTDTTTLSVVSFSCELLLFALTEKQLQQLNNFIS